MMQRRCSAARRWLAADVCLLCSRCHSVTFFTKKALVAFDARAHATACARPPTCSFLPPTPAGGGY